MPPARQKPTQRAEPRLVGVREFREHLMSYTSQVTVVHTRGTIRVIGTWTPERKEPET